MAIIDGTRHAKETCQRLFNRAQSEGSIPKDLPFEVREAPTDPTSTAIRVVAVDCNGKPIPGITVDGVRTITDSTRLAPLSV